MNENLDIVAPIVHLNGSGKENLIEQVKDIIVACRKLENALQQATPHMRDYYILQNGTEVYEKAREQHIARLKNVNQIQTEIEAIGIKIIEQER